MFLGRELPAPGLLGRFGFLDNKTMRTRSKQAFDELAAALGVVQTRNVLDTIRRVADKRVGVVFISHSMPHVLEVSDRVQVLRLGRRVATYATKETTVEQLVGAMTGALDGANG